MESFEDFDRKLDRLMKEPTNSQLFNELGVLLYQAKDWKNSEEYFQRAYELNSSNKDILYNYASLLYLNSKLYEAISIYKYYLEHDPNDKEVIEKARDIYYQLGEYELASKLYDQPQIV